MLRFFNNGQCTKKLGFKNTFNEEYELYQPKETYEYIFSKYKYNVVKMIIVLVYFKDRSSRMQIYVSLCQKHFDKLARTAV
jgi:hypothetical protein